MAIIKIPPMTPPTMAPVFGLPTPESDEVSKDESEVAAGKTTVVGEVVGPVITELGEPMNEPGPISGLPKKRRFEGAKERSEKKNPTTGGRRFVGVPLVLELVWAISTCRRSYIAIITNNDVEESPLRYTCSRRNRVRKAMGRIPCQCQCFNFFAAAGNSRRRRQSLCAVGYIFGPPNGRYMKEDRQRHDISAHVIQEFPWHAPHALRRE